jgi:hypothetical protein
MSADGHQSIIISSHDKGVVMRAMLSFSALVALGAAAVAASPTLFGQSQPGLWEYSGIEGTKTPQRMCIADLAQLAQVEHRGRGCKVRALRGDAAAATFTYECAPNEFGRSEIKFVTPRNFKIVSQGIAGGMPFAHTVQARRVGDCEAKPTPARH